MSHDPVPTRKKSLPLAVILLTGALLLGLLSFLGLQLVRSNQKSLQVGAEIADFSITTFTGEQYQKSALSGKVILLNFWSSWCASCDEEGAALEEVWQEVKDSGEVVFLGVNYVDTEKDATAFLERFRISFPNGPDMGSRISRMFKVQAVPETYLIGGDGKLAAIQVGPFLSADEVRAFLNIAWKKGSQE